MLGPSGRFFRTGLSAVPKGNQMFPSEVQLVHRLLTRCFRWKSLLTVNEVNWVKGSVCRRTINTLSPFLTCVAPTGPTVWVFLWKQTQRGSVGSQRNKEAERSKLTGEVMNHIHYCRFSPEEELCFRRFFFTDNCLTFQDGRHDSHVKLTHQLDEHVWCFEPYK